MGRELNKYSILMYTAVLLLAVLWENSANAQQVVDVSGEDCGAILESYAANPKSVPKEVADACEQALLVAPGAGSPRAQGDEGADLVDPCEGPNASSSVYCWGPWPTLAPAAGGGPRDTISNPEICIGQECIDEPVLIADEIDPPPPFPDLPLGPCQPGLPCGYATVVDGTASVGDPNETSFARIDVAPDGSSFGIDTDLDGNPDIVSVQDMTINVSDRPDEFDNLRAQGVDGDQQSRIVARVLFQGNGDLQYSADVWTDGNRATRTAQSGFFAHGTATTQADIDQLIASETTLTFAGPMSVDNATVANITMEYNANPTWNGSWTNPAYAFSAGGPVDGANFISVADQFSDNVQSGFVQGSLLGPGSDPAVAHIVEVDLDNVGLVRDVGLLRPVTP